MIFNMKYFHFFFFFLKKIPLSHYNRLKSGNLVKKNNVFCQLLYSSHYEKSIPNVGMYCDNIQTESTNNFSKGAEEALVFRVARRAGFDNF